MGRVLELEFGEDVLVGATDGFTHLFVGQDGHDIREGIPVLFTDGYFFPGEIDVFIIERHDLLDGDDVAAMDATKEIAGQQPFPLFQRDEHQGGRSFFEDQPGIILPGLDIEDMPEIHLHKSTFVTDKEE